MLDLITKAIDLLESAKDCLSLEQQKQLADLKEAVDNYSESYFDNFNFD